MPTGAGLDGQSSGTGDLQASLAVAAPQPQEPVKLEASAVPRQNGRGLHDDEAGPPTRPDAG